MEALWSISTTVREAERIIGFLQTATELDNQIWDKTTQIRFQVLLIKNRLYLNDPNNTQSFNNLSEEQIDLLKDKTKQISWSQAKSIFNAKCYEDAPMRGRQSINPLRKLGLVSTANKKLTITDVGRKLANGEIELGDFMLDALLKFQYPNPNEKSFKNWNSKPFISTLRLIQKVNDLCIQNGLNPKGISQLEFGIFALSLKSHKQVNNVAESILDFREQYQKFTDGKKRDLFVKEYVERYLSDFKNPLKNIREYTDNMVRYLRLTKYIYIRGKYSNTYIDLEPRRLTEINSILQNDTGEAVDFTGEQWENYMGTYGAYELPFETISELTKIAYEINREINHIEEKLGIQPTFVNIPTQKNELKELIANQRIYRTKLQNLEIKQDYFGNLQKIDETILALQDIRLRNKSNLVKKYSIELEKWTNIALNILNDSLLIKPNAPVGDDNEPTYTAPSGVADIECYYKEFSSICEVTMLCNRDQWYNEGQPVMRHLRNFENNNTQKPNYCLFIAPKLHTDTINTFYTSVKYEYEGKAQKIIPITIVQLEQLLEAVKQLLTQGKYLKHTQIKNLYDTCSDMSLVKNSLEWLPHIEKSISKWSNSVLRISN